MTTEKLVCTAITRATWMVGAYLAFPPWLAGGIMLIAAVLDMIFWALEEAP